jgi:hypothetical protein
VTPFLIGFGVVVVAFLVSLWQIIAFWDHEV